MITKHFFTTIFKHCFKSVVYDQITNRTRRQWVHKSPCIVDTEVYSRIDQEQWRKTAVYYT